MKKRKVVEAVAKVEISTTGFQVNEEFVRFAIQSIGGGVCVGRKLFVFDHRPATIQAAKAIKPNKAPWESRRKAEEALAALSAAVRQPAKVVVMEKVDGERTFPYVNLYLTKGQEPTALFATTSYVGKHNAGFEFAEDNAFWSWGSESTSRTSRHWEMVLVTLTDDDHKVIVDSYGYANIGHSDKNLTVITTDIRQMASEELAVGFQP